MTYLDSQGFSELLSIDPFTVLVSKTATITGVADDVGSLQGQVAHGGTSDDSTPTISGTLSAPLVTGETLQIFNGTTLLGSATVNNIAGTWTFTPTLPATAGNSYAITARVADEVGNLGTPSAVRTFSLDTKAPSTTATITSVADGVGLLQGQVANGGTTDDPNLTISGTLSAALKTGENLWIFNGTTLLGSATVNNLARTWTFMPTLPATAGSSYAITARVADEAGIMGTASAVRTFTLNTTAPATTATITGVADEVGLLQGQVATGGSTDDPTPTISGTLSAALATGETLRIFNGTTLLSSATVNNIARTWTFRPTLPATAGTGYTITARVADEAGNLGTASAVRIFSLDTKGPATTATITGFADDVGLLQGQLAHGGSTDDPTPTISGTLSAALATGETLWIFNGTTLLGSATVNNTARTWTFRPTLPATAGSSYTITARVADEIGILGNASAARTFSLDTTAPATTATITGVADDVGLFQGQVSHGGSTDDPTPTISGTLAAALATGETLRVFNGTTLLGSATVNNTARTWTFRPTLPATAGTRYTITARVADEAGNLGTASAARRFSLNTTAPPADGFVLATVIGNVAFGSTPLGYALQDGSSASLSITNAGVVVTETGGWRALAATASGNGYDLYWKNSNGLVAKWSLNSSAGLTSAFVISTVDFLQAESSLDTDLDADGNTGFSFSLVNTVGSVQFGHTQVGYGLKNGSNSVQPITNAGAVATETGGWRALAAAASGNGYDLYWKNSNGLVAKWTLNSSAGLTSASVISTADFLQAERNLFTDLDTDGNIGFSFSAAKTIGSVQFGNGQDGYALKNGSDPLLAITSAGAVATESGGWRALAAAASGNGYDLYWKNIDGSYAKWLLNSAAEVTSAFVISTADFLQAESSLVTDLDADGKIGFSFSAATTIGTVQFGNSQIGYALKHGTNALLSITNAGTVATETGGWRALAAAASGNGYELYWKHINGTYAKWILNSSAALTSAFVIRSADFLLAESSLATDLDADGITGPFAMYRGTAVNDMITGQGNVSFGLAGNDTLTAAASSLGFDILIGGTGSDKYVLPDGTTAIIADEGNTGGDSLTALGLAFNRPSTVAATLEGGRHLIIDDSSTGSRIYLMDWTKSANQIETITLADGRHSFAQVQQKIQSLGSLKDYTWAQWDSQFSPGSPLTRLGIASSSAIDNFSNYYRTVSNGG